MIDARKGILTQTRRHSIIATLLGIRHLVLAINKMDLVGYQKSVYDQIVEDYKEFAKALPGQLEITPIPISALAGDNITERSPETPWYTGPSLMDILETVEIARDRRVPAAPHAGPMGQSARTSISAASPAPSPPAR
jgi:sulfate adenylyltransferase subunit 1 (EFTu-like GTPase family)